MYQIGSAWGIELDKVGSCSWKWEYRAAVHLIPFAGPCASVAGLISLATDKHDMSYHI